MTNSSSKLNSSVVDSLSALNASNYSSATGPQLETSTNSGRYKKITDDKTSNDSPAKKGRIHAFDHITYWVGNAKQAASFYMTHLGFEPIAFKGLETGSRDMACHALKLNDIVVQFVCAVQPNDEPISDFLKKHGDAVKDVAFQVENIEDMLEHALGQGAELVYPLETVEFDSSGDSGDSKLAQSFLADGSTSDNNKSINRATLKRATIKAFADFTHTFIERNYEYSCGRFQPGYSEPSLKLPPAFSKLPKIKAMETDHVVGQFIPNKLIEMHDWYVKVLKFKRFWSVDEKLIRTEHSGVKTFVMTNDNEKIKIPLCEVILSEKAKSKSEEFVRFNYGSGIHHIALKTDDIISVVSNLKDRGLEFLHTPDTYYSQLKDRLKDCSLEIKEDIEELRKLKILVDFDEQGYLLQIFTRPVQDRPTFIFEFIQRFEHDGFGAGNFLALFKAIEAETALRGNL